MKITDLSTFIVNAYRCNWVFVKIFTDDGLVGIGEGTLEMRERTVAQAIEELGRYLIGKDPFAIESHIHLMHRDSYWRNGVVLRTALSAVEAAMFDIKGKALGVPVYELLGGRVRDSVKCYANGWFAGASTPSAFADRAKPVVELGFKALKFDPFGSAYKVLEPAARQRAVDIVEAVREAVGPNVDLLIEAHGRFDVPDAVTVGRRLAPYLPYWIEEPVPPESLAALAEVRRSIPVPVAAGERFYEPQRALEALESGAVDFLQPDVCHVGGLLETKRVASLAALFGKSISAHNPNGPVCNAMTLQIAASTPNFGMLETMLTDVPWRHELVPENLEMVDGCLGIPRTPGLGVELDEECVEKHPYAPCELRHYNGDLTHIRPIDARPWFTVRRNDRVSA